MHRTPRSATPHGERPDEARVDQHCAVADELATRAASAAGLLSRITI
jgi:hypothetical protein